MIEKINTNQIPDYMDKSASKQPNTTGAAPDVDADLSVDVNYASLISKATQVPETDNQIVQRAKELLKSGELDNPENIKQAAENIVTYGI
jgi:hypothetical protein